MQRRAYIMRACLLTVLLACTVGASIGQAAAAQNNTTTTETANSTDTASPVDQARDATNNTTRQVETAVNNAKQEVRDAAANATNNTDEPRDSENATTFRAGPRVTVLDVEKHPETQTVTVTWRTSAPNRVTFIDVFGGAKEDKKVQRVTQPKVTKTVASGTYTTTVPVTQPGDNIPGRLAISTQYQDADFTLYQVDYGNDWFDLETLREHFLAITALGGGFGVLFGVYTTWRYLKWKLASGWTNIFDKL